MDAGVRDPSSGDIMVMSREDDVINVAGHRLSTSAIEEVNFYGSQKVVLLYHITYFVKPHQISF